MELLLLRHAQPAWVIDSFAQVDPPLTDLGDRQADLAADRLAGIAVDEVLISTALRAQQTARPLLERLPDLPNQSRAWLHEIRSPESWQDTPGEEVNRILREARDRPRDAWWDGMDSGGESFRDFHARVVDGLTHELAQHGIVRDDETGLWEVQKNAIDRILLVAHAGTNSVVLGHLLGVAPEPWEWERFASNHASITTLATTPISGHHIFSLQGFSDVAHFDGALVTE